MKNRLMRLPRRAACLAVSGGMLMQFGGCDFGQITTTVTLDTRTLLIGVVRGAILTPLDEFLTGAIDRAFGVDD